MAAAATSDLVRGRTSDRSRQTRQTAALMIVLIFASLRVASFHTELASLISSRSCDTTSPGGLGPQPTEKVTNQAHFCILDAKSLPYSDLNHFKHFPHCMEAVLPCWSWFRSQHATNDCGFVLLDGLNFGKETSWQSQLVRYMGCVVHNDSTPSYGVQHRPNAKWMNPRFGRKTYLGDPEDAQALRRLVMPDGDEIIRELRGDGKPLQIGLIQRRPNPHRVKQRNRVVTNIRDIEAGLRQALPGANVTTTFLEHPRIEDQATWFATKDVIVAAHGAALTNSIFVTRGTFVLQLYPPGFHWQSLDPLIEQSGGIALDWYNGMYNGVNPIVVHEENKKDWHANLKSHHGDFAPPVEEVVDIILVALGKREPAKKLARFL